LQKLVWSLHGKFLVQFFLEDNFDQNHLDHTLFHVIIFIERLFQSLDYGYEGLKPWLSTP
jgi:hypothetical protein